MKTFQQNLYDLAELLAKTTYVIEVFETHEELNLGRSYSQGSGVAVSQSGALITAAHVLYGTTKIDPSNWTGKEVVLARTQNGSWQPYRAITCGINIFMPNIMREPLGVDLAFLSPIPKLQDVPHVKVSPGVFKPGTQVLMAGFPDEVEPPLSFHRLIDRSNPNFAKPEHYTPRKIVEMQQQLMIKSGILGYSQDASFDLDPLLSPYKLTAYYVDNGMHSGASGGPVLSLDGELIGTITQRAITTVSNLELKDPNVKIPSGSTLAISSHSVVDYLDRIVPFYQKQKKDV